MKRTRKLLTLANTGAFVFFIVCGFFSSAQATQLNQVYVYIGTGNDDLRAGSQIRLRISVKDRTPFEVDLAQGRRFGDRTATSRVFPVSPPIDLADINNVKLLWSPGRCDLPCMTDQWEITELRIHAGAGPGDPLLRNAIETQVPDRRVLPADRPGVAGEVTGAMRILQLPHKFGESDDKVFVFYVENTLVTCTSDNDCSDGNFCNGVEACSPANPAADALGCITGTPACTGGLLCNERAQRCERECVDNDGDGHLAASCGGDDCADSDANRYPGNVEVFDPQDHDEDCDVNTHGVFRGAASTQLCDGRDRVVLVDEREQFTRARCMSGTVCVQQPNGSGVCMPEPSGYQAPSAARLPAGPQKAPPESLYKTVRDKNFLNLPIQLSPQKNESQKATKESKE